MLINGGRERSLEGPRVAIASGRLSSSIFWPADAKSRLTGKDPDAGKDRHQEKGTIEDEMVGWHQCPNGHEFEQTQGDSEGQGSLVCCSPWGRKEWDTAERLNGNNNNSWPILKRSSSYKTQEKGAGFLRIYIHPRGKGGSMWGDIIVYEQSSGKD